MSDNGTRLWWDGDGWSPSGGSGLVRVIDSWLVDDGRVRCLDLHARRFSEACGRFSAPETDGFLRAVAEALPTSGRWFPRVELVETGPGTRLRLWLRPAPPRTSTVRMWNSGPDRRTAPAVKGIDLDHLASLRSAALAAGADEAFLLSPRGHVLEGSTTSIVWWRGDVLCGPPLGAIFPGITRSLLGPVAEESATPDDLADVPVWTVNALHGIRPVTEGLGRCREPDLVMARHWQSRLEALASAPVPIT